MFRVFVLLSAVLALGACKSYKDEYLQTQQRLQQVEAQVTTLQRDIQARDQAIGERDRAIAERDQVIREQCILKPQE